MTANRHPEPTASADDQRIWQVVGNHVLPVDDLREHCMKNCWCRPTEDEGVVVHNSVDGREFYERGERRFS
jgi:hypothetical protein